MEGEKIVWLELSNNNRFSFSTEGEYILNSAWMITGKDLKYFLGVLNSKLTYFYFTLIANNSRMGTNQWRKYAVEQIPIPKRNQKNSTNIEKIVKKVEEVLILKHKELDSFKPEQEIDHLVYKLYGLTPEEIEIIESTRGD